MVQSICKRQSIPRLLTYFVTRKLTENEMCMEFRFAIKIENEKNREVSYETSKMVQIFVWTMFSFGRQ